MFLTVCVTWMVTIACDREDDEFMRVVEVTLFALPARYRVINSAMLYTFLSLIWDTPRSNEWPSLVMGVLD